MFGRNSKEYRNWLKRKSDMEKMPYHLRVVNTGSTIGYRNFDYQYWSVEGYNLGGQPQTLYYDFEVLKKFSDHIEKGANICLCIEPFKLLVDAYSAKRADYPYYFFLDREQILRYEESIQEKLFSWPGLLDKGLLRSEGVAVLKKLMKKSSSRQNHMTTEDKNKWYAELYIKNWKNEFEWCEKYILTENQKKNIRENISRLQEMLLYCETKQWIPFIVIPPMISYISRYFPEDIWEECLWKPIQAVQMLNHPVVDLFHDEILCDANLYEDAISFNEKGKKLFNEKLQRIILIDGRR